MEIATHEGNKYSDELVQPCSLVKAFTANMLRVRMLINTQTKIELSDDIPDIWTYLFQG